MVQNSQTTTWDGAKNDVNDGKETTNLNWLAGFLNHQQYVLMNNRSCLNIAPTKKATTSQTNKLSRGKFFRDALDELGGKLLSWETQRRM